MQVNVSVQQRALRERFLSRLPQRLDSIRAHAARIETGDTAAAVELKRAAHSLVGAAGMYNLADMAECAARIEAWDDSPNDVQALLAAIDHLAVLIEQQRQSHAHQ